MNVNQKLQRLHLRCDLHYFIEREYIESLVLKHGEPEWNQSVGIIFWPSVHLYIKYRYLMKKNFVGIVILW